MSWPVLPHGFLGSQAATGDQDTYQIQRSLRFNSADSAYLNRTPASAGNRKTWTWSGWVKRGSLGGNNVFMGNTDSSGYNGLYFQFDTSNNITIGDYGVGSYAWVLTTSQVFRDTSAWYHIVATFDSTQATTSDRVSLYVNGVKTTAFTTASYPSLNLDGRINSTQLTSIGRLGSYNGFYFDGYLTEINFIDGQALTPSSFGETDAITGRWKAKAYSGTYGTNGFYLPFLNNSSTITANLLTYSEEFNDASWSKFQSTIATNATTAPNGTTTAEKLVETVTTGGHSVFKSFTATDNTDYTFSCYLKASERNIVLLNIQKKDGTSYPKAEFNLTSGTIVSFDAGVTANITSVGSGWYRCSMAVNVGTGATASPNVFVQHVTVGNGDGTSGFFLWGAQLEPTATLGQYLNTGATAITTSLRLGEDKSISTGGYNNWVANNFSVSSGAGNDSLTDSPANYGTISTTLTNDTYQISRSLRFNSADSAYLSRTPASAGNRKTWTWSGWVKRSALSSLQYFFGAGTGSNDATFAFYADDTFVCFLNDGTGATGLRTSSVYRDISSWYHIVVSLDTTQSTSTNRQKIYINGSEVTAFGTANYPNQNTDWPINNTNAHDIGRARGGSYFNGYLTEINFIDGQALTPDSFGVRDASTYLWKPKAYTGTYGTNGFYLNFSDNSGTTATTLGKDQAGSNNWTPFNFSVASGVGNDSLVDTPTYYGTDAGAGGEARGDYCTLDPTPVTNGTFSQGNLRYVGPGSWKRANGTIAVSTGKWYYEVTLGNAPFSPRNSSSGWNAFGFGLASVLNSTTGANGVSDALTLTDSGYYTNFNGSGTDGGTAFSSGDVLSVAVDLDANTYTFRRNNTQIVTGTIGGTAGRLLTPCIISYDGQYGVMDINFGQRPFAYAAPSGFRALRDYNKIPVPTGGVVRGNYATLDPLGGSTRSTYSNGNLQVSGSGANGGDFGSSYSSIGVRSGKWYAEFTYLSGGENASIIGVGSHIYTRGAANQNGVINGITSINLDATTAANRCVYENGTALTGGDASFSFSVNDIIGVAFDAGARTVNFYKNGSILGSTYPYDVASVGAGEFYFIACTRVNSGTSSFAANFGQRPFAFGAPFGFMPLCTTLLPTPTIKKPSKYMDVVTYTGNGTSPRTVSGFGFSPDFLWIKNRTDAYNHIIYDTVRGAGSSKGLSSNTTKEENNTDNTNYGYVSAFTSDGFSVETGSIDFGLANTSTKNYVAWAWDEAPIAGMDIVSYTGNGTNRTIAHNLGVAPKMIIVKNRNFVGSTNWCVYHSSLSSPANSVFLDTTDAQASYPTVWNSTAPTSSVFSVGTNLSSNGNGNNIIAYLFAEVEGFSKFGSFTGNGSADGPFVWCGFRPKFVLWKNSDNATSNWDIWDSSRNQSNVVDRYLDANLSNAEGTFSQMDFVSNGFKLRGSTNSGQTIIFAAFAESPFKYSRAR